MSVLSAGVRFAPHTCSIRRRILVGSYKFGEILDILPPMCLPLVAGHVSFVPRRRIELPARARPAPELEAHTGHTCLCDPP
jgi:hypothetical protein